ncbi:phosphodiester glycosidase family protein [Haploplasma axanthum]|uniref:Exopolysaccharide biosynthesis protein related to N-acetylglucosamine-1-phosphodiester alpha-N-acetylglucosaminidase n=1 Tax=Haploplasma axanthum TaxID=29552 RepID=A0A449BD11_HAPAX|nr:phosphodiester glycosidase family protein [Haploplasma axanthum]VEU80315.1 Exopolysaccharide biosynthesis protein related to N-acetylglucosamine-1-phosphodiester alpha-N-acetylglucosaminidase [Haploplasma axanthum]
MKKILTLSLVIPIIFLVLINPFEKINANTYYRFDAENRKTEYINNFVHTRVNGKLTYGNEETNQHYNVLKLGLNQKEGINLVSVDAYKDFGYGMAGLNGLMANYEINNPNMEVLGGFSGDFYMINDNGEPIGTYIVDYEIRYPGNTTNSVVLAINTDGSVEFKKVKKLGKEVIIKNKYGEIKKRSLIDNINVEPSNDLETTVLFDNYEGRVSEGLRKIIVKGTDIKYMYNEQPIVQNPKYYGFAKGIKSEDGKNQVSEREFIVVSNEIEKIVEEDDIIIVQEKIEGFENVRNAVGTYATHLLVENGENAVYTPEPYGIIDRHPRTAVGITKDGDVIAVVIDGRNKIAGRDGVKFGELAEIMRSHGAITAYNFDGGGSSTLMIGNSNGYEVLNELSDKRIRSLSNGFLIVKGDLKQKPLEIETPDNRSESNIPSNLYISNDTLFFSEGDTGYYEVKINNLVYEVANNRLALNFIKKEGIYKISVRSKGNKDKKTSKYSNEIVYKVNSEEVNSLLQLLKNINIGVLK